MIPPAMQAPTQNRTLNDPIEQDHAQTLFATDRPWDCGDVPFASAGAGAPCGRIRRESKSAGAIPPGIPTSRGRTPPSFNR